MNDRDLPRLRPFRHVSPASAAAAPCRRRTSSWTSCVSSSPTRSSSSACVAAPRATRPTSQASFPVERSRWTPPLNRRAGHLWPVRGARERARAALARAQAQAGPEVPHQDARVDDRRSGFADSNADSPASGTQRPHPSPLPTSRRPRAQTHCERSSRWSCRRSTRAALRLFRPTRSSSRPSSSRGSFVRSTRRGECAPERSERASERKKRERGDERKEALSAVLPSPGFLSPLPRSPPQHTHAHTIVLVCAALRRTWRTRKWCASC